MAEKRQSRQHKKGRRPGPKPSRLLPEIQDAFLEAYGNLGTIWHAAIEAGINRQTHYDWLASDEAYKARFQEAESRALDTLEREARRRAAQGVDEPVFYMGKECGTVRKYSDTLLIFLLKGANPSKYRERFEHTGPNGGALQSTVTFTMPDNGRRAEG